MAESCNSRHFKCLMKSCFPNPNDTTKPSPLPPPQPQTTIISVLPDDILIECLARVPPSSLQTLPLVSKRWAHLLSSPTFLSLRRHHGHLTPTLFALSATDSALFSATLRLNSWKLSLFLPNDAASLLSLLSHARLASIGPRIYILGRNGTARYDTWTGHVTARSPMLLPRKKFAAATVHGKIYIAGGGPGVGTLEEYDPDNDTWRVVSHTPVRRYGCVGASVGSVFYVIGGLKIGGAWDADVARANAAHLYPRSMDLYDVETRVWLRSGVLPNGGCVVAGCAANGHVYVLASHAVHLSFWRFEAHRKTNGENNGGFGEWCRMKSPPLPAQVRLDSTVRFSCVGVENKVVLIQVMGCIDDLLRRSGRSVRGYREGLVLVYDTVVGEWTRGPDLPEVVRRAACVCVEC